MICEDLEKVDIRKLPVAPAGEVCISGHRVVVAETECAPFGGKRKWFLCPRCGRRCAILYLVGRLVCRLCTGARYHTENLGYLDRRLAAAFKIRKRLGQRGGGIVGPFPSKPSRMRWRTYNDIVKEGREIEAEIWQVFINQGRKGFVA